MQDVYAVHSMHLTVLCTLWKAPSSRPTRRWGKAAASCRTTLGPVGLSPGFLPASWHPGTAFRAARRRLRAQRRRQGFYTAPQRIPWALDTGRCTVEAQVLTALTLNPYPGPDPDPDPDPDHAQF